MTDYDVAVDVKIFVEDNSSIELVKKELTKITKVHKVIEEEIGFGIKVIKATLLLSDKDGGMDSLERKIREIKDVTELEVENVTRI